MYMPGRLRTGSSPSRTVMSFAVYVDAIGSWKIIYQALSACDYADPRGNYTD